MSAAGKRLIDATAEALAVARGEKPAARIWHNGWPYIPESATVDEAIVCAAVVLDGQIWQLPRPARHHHILRAIDHVLPGRAIEAHIQGFMTNRGRYVTRAEAAHIAKMAGQVGTLHAPPDLFSEDLW